jgi:hypothetical protein
VNTAWTGLIQVGDQIRFNNSGPLFQIVNVPGPEQLRIDRLYIGPNSGAVGFPYQIIRQPLPVAGAEPLTFPSDVVINVSPNARPLGLPTTWPVERRSRNIPFQFGFDNSTAFTLAWVTGGDGAPGASGVDDDRDGLVDDPVGDGSGLAELGFPGTNDVAAAAWPPMDILCRPTWRPTTPWCTSGSRSGARPR